MATVEITTWDEFVTALTETITEATTYEIMNDIDVSGEIIDSAITIPFNSSYEKIFQPTSTAENITINGITSYSSNVIFILTGGGTSSKRCATFNNIHFANIMCSNNILLRGDFYSGSNTYRFNNCLFNGVVKQLCENNNTMNNTSIRYTNIHFDKCSFNIACGRFCQSASYYGYYVYFSNCYIIFQNEIRSNQYYNLSGRFTASDCYFGGEFETTSTSNPPAILNSLCTNCVFNVEITTPVTLDSFTTSTGEYCLINIDKTPSYYSVFTNCYGLTDEQLQSRTYIQENTNFPLYG